MSKNFNSPYASSFKSAVKRGTPCSVAVNNIANKKKTTCKTVFESLCKAGLCNKQKFNGQWIYWPCDELVGKKSSATQCKTAQTMCWQSFIDWCICNGCCTPVQLDKCKGSQSNFMKFCKKFWSKQFTTSTKTTAKSSRKSTSKSTSRSSYRFPTSGRSTSRKAA